jgi:glycosyltransferase involved in cell wall biosynthesis
MEQSYSSFEDLGFFGYSTGSLEALTYLSPTSCFTVLDQISPGQVEKEIVLDESERWPGWATTLPVLHPSFQERLEKEWHLASQVLVNSEWSKEALVEQGVSAAKIAVVPLAYDPPTARPHMAAPPPDRPLRVLWLGTVNLRKGIPYLLKAAKQLLPRNVEIRIVGPLQITEKARAFAPSNVEFVGRVPRDKVSAQYRDADVFVLPTLSDGFAITQLEAMAHGLPVIATPRCGRVVTDGRDGFVVPVRDADRLAAAIATLDDDRDRIASMSQNALQTSQNYTLSHLAQRLREALPA